MAHPRRAAARTPAPLRALTLAALGAGLATGCTVVSRTTSSDAAPVVERRTAPERAALNPPYSDAVRVGDLLFLSGAIGTAPGSRGVVPGGIAAETRQTLENIRTTLAASGLTMDDVVKCTVMLADIGEWEAMNVVYREFFPRNKPARSALGVSGLVANARVEIECIAALRAR